MTDGKLLKASVLKGMADGLNGSDYAPLCSPELEDAAVVYDKAYRFGQSYTAYIDARVPERLN